MQEDLAARRAPCDRQIAAGRDTSCFAAFSAGLQFALSGAHQTFSRKVKIAKESKRGRMREWILTSTAASEQLRNMVSDQRNRRVQRAAAVSRALEAIEALETKNNEDEQWRKDIDKAVSWFQQFLGFQVVAEVEGVKFIFDKVDLQVPEKEFSMVLKFDKDSEELLQDLNLANDLPKFVRITRQRIQAASMNGPLPVSTTLCPDASPPPISSRVITSVDSTSRNDADQSHSQSKNEKRALPAKRRASALSAAPPGSVRRSPLFPRNR